MPILNTISPDYGGNRVTNIGTPVAAMDATTKQYVDDRVATVGGTAGSIPVGGIIMWSGSTSTIPAGWALCNGSNGTPNLLNRFVVAAGGSYTVGATGGGDSFTIGTNNLPNHTHGITDPGHLHAVNITSAGSGGHGHQISSSGLHTHTTDNTGNHQHNGYYRSIYTGNGSFMALTNQPTASGTSTAATANDGTHTHTISSSGSHTHTTDTVANHQHTVAGNTATGTTGISVAQGGGTASPAAIDKRPQYYALAYIMRIA